MAVLLAFMFFSIVTCGKILAIKVKPFYQEVASAKREKADKQKILWGN